MLVYSSIRDPDMIESLMTLILKGGQSDLLLFLKEGKIFLYDEEISVIESLKDFYHQLLFSISKNIKKNLFFDVFKSGTNLSILESMKNDDEYEIKSNSTITEDYNSNFNFHIDKFLIKETTNDDININNFDTINQESNLTNIKENKQYSKENNSYYSNRLNLFIKDNIYKGNLNNYEININVNEEIEFISIIIEEILFPEKFSSSKCSLI